MFRFLFKSKSCNASERPAEPRTVPVSKPCMEALESRQLMSVTAAPAPLTTAPARPLVVSYSSVNDGATPEQAARGQTGPARVRRITNVRANANGLGAS